MGRLDKPVDKEKSKLVEDSKNLRKLFPEAK